MEESFLEQEIKSGSLSCYKNTHRATLPIEIISIRPEITWWTQTLFTGTLLLCELLQNWSLPQDHFLPSRDQRTEHACYISLSEICFHSWRLQQYLSALSVTALFHPWTKCTGSWSAKKKKSTFEAYQLEDSHSVLVRFIPCTSFV